MSRRQSTKARPPQRKRSPQPSTEEKNEVLPVRRRGLWYWIIGILIVLLIGLASWHGIISNMPASASSTTANSPGLVAGNNGTATSPWQILQTYSGQATNDTYTNTKQFTIDTSNWQITWSCSALDGNDEYLAITIYNPDGSLYNAGAQITCVASKKVNEGSVIEQKGGTFYLAINATTAWTVHVQVPT